MGQQTRPKRIAVLVVDDEPMIRSFLAEWPERDWDLDVVEASRYGEAAEYLEGEPDLWIALVDCLVHPDGTIGPFYRRIKPTMDARNGTIIGMTGGNMRPDEARMLKADQVGIIEKPWMDAEAEVLPHIQRAIRKRWTRERLEAELLPLLFRAVLAKPEPITPEEAALEDQWQDPDAWRQLLPKSSGNEGEDS